MLIHPSYDPVANVWFTDEGIEAKTLDALRARLPGVTIKDCYSGGHTLDDLMGKMRARALSESLVKKAPAKVFALPAIPKEEPVVVKKEPKEPEKRTWVKPIHFNWTPESEKQLRHLSRKGFSASQIAAEMGATKNAIIGKAARLGLSLARRSNGQKGKWS